VELADRPVARGTFLFADGEKLTVRGVTYGPFRPLPDGPGYPRPEVVAADFATMASAGVNAVRTYTVPPPWLFDLALDQGLRVLVGLPWEQHVAFLDERSRRASIERRVREGVAACVEHEAVLGYALGNEIPSSIVRWYGARRVERFLERLYRAGKTEDPNGLFAYVNYPSTEYLDASFDLVCFNVYLERARDFEAYVARLQNVAGDRPLVLAELGLDSDRNGEARQARTLSAQLAAASNAGCAGAFVFSWTDEWYRGSDEIADWSFGVVDRKRRPKAALAAVKEAYSSHEGRQGTLPPISVCVCTFNGAATLGRCLREVASLDYPQFETIVVDDGSTDETAAIAADFGARLIRTERCGLSSARNTALAAAVGEIVAFIDDDAYPDRYWLRRLSATFSRTSHAGIGGPNLAVPDDGFVASCVARAPGGPVHVLLTDTVAEHIPGCNMAFRAETLRKVGGFDPRFRVAGDDVDICWTLQEHGYSLGFDPSAVVWHHRRNSVRGYLRQQRGYGAAEAILARKWPSKYNRRGHPRWLGRIYISGAGADGTAGRRPRIRYGTWGTGLFQSVYSGRLPLGLAALPTTPEWYLLLGALALATVYEAAAGSTAAALVVGSLLLACLAALVVQSARGARSALRGRPRSTAAYATVTLLTVLQPLGRLGGRLRAGVPLFERSAPRSFAVPLPSTRTVWSERSRSTAEVLGALEAAVGARGLAVQRGGEFDRWDLQLRSGPLASTRIRLAIEQHEAGRQLLRFRVWPRWSTLGVGATSALLVSATLALRAGQDLTAALVTGSFAVLLGGMLVDAAVSTGAVTHSVRTDIGRAADGPTGQLAHQSQLEFVRRLDEVGDSV
jgi:glycosyltransferase involved in cell wall biosynthesis